MTDTELLNRIRQFVKEHNDEFDGGCKGIRSILVESEKNE